MSLLTLIIPNWNPFNFNPVELKLDYTMVLLSHDS